MTIKIPLFAHSKLSKVYLKPILNNNIPYILSSQTEYLIEGQFGPNYFSDLNQNCFYTNKKLFCKKPTSQNNCDNQYVAQSSKKFDEKCFTRLPLRNTVTQIKNDIYFLIIEPMTINISCYESNYSIKISQSSKILNNTCQINSTFFTFDPNSVSDNGIFFSDSTDNLNEWNLYNKIEQKTIIQIYCFFTFLCFYLIILAIVIYFYHKLDKKGRTYSPYHMETMV